MELALRKTISNEGAQKDMVLMRMGEIDVEFTGEKLKILQNAFFQTRSGVKLCNG